MPPPMTRRMRLPESEVMGCSHGRSRELGIKSRRCPLPRGIMPNKPKPRVLLADVDGTLVTQQKVLTQEALTAARELRAAGITLALTSGRPPRGMAMLIEPLELTGPIAGFNGGVFVNPDLSVIESHPLDPAVAREASDLILA